MKPSTFGTESSYLVASKGALIEGIDISESLPKLASQKVVQTIPQHFAALLRMTDGAKPSASADTKSDPSGAHS